jgi:hypothetical protein
MEVKMNGKKIFCGKRLMLCSKSKVWLIFIMLFILWGVTNSEGGEMIRVKDLNQKDHGTCEVTEDFSHIPNEKAPDLPQAPGWPQTTGGACGLCPMKGTTFSDLDHDGNLEIIAVSTDGTVYVWDYLGNLRPGWPQTVIGIPQFAPAIGDINGDGLLEIALTTWQTWGRVYVFDRDGNVLPGWPVSFNDHEIVETPALSDLDGDGKLEIIVGERDYPMGYLHVLRYDGTEFPGNWPFELDGVPGAGASVGDIDNDGQKEIIYLSVYSVYAFESDGTLMPGWPYTQPGCEFSYSGPALADFEGDGYLEIVCSCCLDWDGVVGGYFFVLDYQGNPLPGWPRPASWWTYCPPSVGDVNQDGNLEIAVGDGGWVLHLFDIYGNYLPGFPLDRDAAVEGPISIADLEEDSTMELIFDSNVILGPDTSGFLWAVYSNGDSVPDWPLRTYSATYMNGSTVGDVNDDGILEVSTISCDPIWQLVVNVNLWNLPKSYRKTSIEWGTYHFDNERTGLYRRRSPNLPPQSFSLISPDSGRVVLPNPTYVWHKSTNPDTIGGSVSYTLKYSLSPIFWGYEQIDGLTDTFYTLSEDLASDTIYYWRVKADDGAPNGITWADQGFFRFRVQTYIYGDTDGDGVVDLLDVAYLMNYLFKEDEPPVPLEAGDPNNDCVVNSADVVYLINYLFKYGPDPLQGCA